MSCVKFLHCNACYHIYDKSKKMYILSCLHTVCKNCLANSNRGRECPKCNEKITFKELNNELDPKLKEFFKTTMPPSLNHTLEIMRFRDRQNHHLIMYYVEMHKKLQKCRENNVYFRSKCEEMEVYCNKLRHCRESLEKRLRPLRAKYGAAYLKRPIKSNCSPLLRLAKINMWNLKNKNNSANSTHSDICNRSYPCPMKSPPTTGINRSFHNTPSIRSLPIDDSFYKRRTHESFGRNSVSYQQGRSHNTSSHASTSFKNNDRSNYYMRSGIISSPSSYDKFRRGMV